MRDPLNNKSCAHTQGKQPSKQAPPPPHLPCGQRAAPELSQKCKHARISSLSQLFLQLRTSLKRKHCESARENSSKLYNCANCLAKFSKPRECAEINFAAVFTQQPLHANSGEIVFSSYFMEIICFVNSKRH